MTAFLTDYQQFKLKDMTREKEIQKAAKEIAQDIEDWEIAEDIEDAFMEGALWADRTMIDKACEWLTRELCYTARGINLFNNKAATDEFVESFKKAMKGGENENN